MSLSERVRIRAKGGGWGVENDEPSHVVARFQRNSASRQATEKIGPGGEPRTSASLEDLAPLKVGQSRSSVETSVSRGFVGSTCRR